MRKNINSYLTAFVTCIVVMAALSSCIKSREGRTDFSSLQPIMMIREGGLAKFSSQALVFPGTDEADTVYFRVNYAAKDVAPSDVTVKLGYDESALNAYNGSLTPADSPYAKFPDSIYSFTSTEVTIKAGQSFSDPIPLIVYPSKINPTKNYMFPITITDANGINISGNFGTVYYHLIGNPIAGAYNQEWIRYNATDTSGTPAYDQDLSPGIFSPVNATTVSIPSGTGVNYLLSFTNNGGVLSDFTVKFPSDEHDPGSPAYNSITITGGPTIQVADPIAGIYRFYFTYNNSSGSPRVIMDQFIK